MNNGLEQFLKCIETVSQFLYVAIFAQLGPQHELSLLHNTLHKAFMVLYEGRIPVLLRYGNLR